MVKGKATATVQGRKLAEADEYEVVEGNVYVCLPIPPFLGFWCLRGYLMDLG